MPKKLNFFESAIRSLLKKYIERGKVDLYISYEDYTEDNYALKYNEGLAGEYLKYLNAMAETFQSSSSSISCSSITKTSG